MRILQFFLRFGILAAGIGALIFFFGGLVWLNVATGKIQNDARSLLSMQSSLDQYSQLCQSAPGSSTNSAPIGFQLRFSDETHYAIEITCSLIEDTPVVIDSQTLPPLITKAPGSSGLYFSLTGDNNSAIILTSLGKNMTLSLVHDKVSFEAGAKTLPLTLRPKSSCQGFGYSCCSGATQNGMGDVRTDDVIDCPGKCFRSCSNVPFVQLFVSDPPATLDTREVFMNSGTLDVTFSYAVQAAASSISVITIDYGDGGTQRSTSSQGVFTHTYTCASSCKYTATLSAKDTANIQTVENASTTIYIEKK